MLMREVVIVSGARTAVGNFGGALKDVSVVTLGSIVIKEAIKRAGIRPLVTQDLLDFAPDVFQGAGPCELEKKYADWGSDLKEVKIDEVIMGNGVPAGQGQNTARQASIAAGVPKETNAFTVNKVCASGMKSIALGAQAIRAGEADVIVAGGMENMSNIPYAFPKGRWGARMFNADFVDLMVHDGLWEIFYGYHMGVTAENIAEKYGITREEQDELGLISHQRARAAIASGILKEEIVPVEQVQKGKTIVFDVDERPMDTTLEKMAKLATVFKKNGTVTAGNASGINDAAAAVVLMSKDKAKELGLEPLATITGYAAGGVDPAYMGLGPVPATRKVLRAAGLEIKDIDLIELNEAFASQAISCIRELGLSMDNTNVNGSGISIGHPIGCTGARIVLALACEMKRRNLKRGLATLCIGGGQGMSMLVER